MWELYKRYTDSVSNGYGGNYKGSYDAYYGNLTDFEHWKTISSTESYYKGFFITDKDMKIKVIVNISKRGERQGNLGIMINPKLEYGYTGGCDKYLEFEDRIGTHETTFILKKNETFDVVMPNVDGPWGSSDTTIDLVEIYVEVPPEIIPIDKAPSTTSLNDITNYVNKTTESIKSCKSYIAYVINNKGGSATDTETLESLINKLKDIKF